MSKVEIEFLTGMRKPVTEDEARVLVGAKVAKYVTREIKPEPDPIVEAEEISPRTGKPKRKYERRDMKAKD